MTFAVAKSAVNLNFTSDPSTIASNCPNPLGPFVVTKPYTLISTVPVLLAISVISCA